MKKRMVQFPMMATMYMRQMGMETQMLADSSPGIPMRKKVAISVSEVLKIDIPEYEEIKMRGPGNTFCSDENCFLCDLSSMSWTYIAVEDLKRG